MKKVIRNLAIAFAFIATISQTVTAQTYVSNNSVSSQLTVASIKIRMESFGYELASDDYFTLANGKTAFKMRECFDDTDYAIIAVPTETGVNDLDINVYNSNGSLYTKDTDARAISMVMFSPSWDRTFKIEVKNYNSDRSYYEYDCRLLIFRKAK